MADKKPFARNTNGLQAHAQQKAEETRKRVIEAIDRLFYEKQSVNFNVVAKAAGVTKSYLYTQADIRKRIESLRQQPQTGLQFVEVVPQERSRTEKSKDMVIAAKDRRIRELEERVRELERRLKIKMGEEYAQI